MGGPRILYQPLGNWHSLEQQDYLEWYRYNWSGETLLPLEGENSDPARGPSHRSLLENTRAHSTSDERKAASDLVELIPILSHKGVPG